MLRLGHLTIHCLVCNMVVTCDVVNPDRVVIVSAARSAARLDLIGIAQTHTTGLTNVMRNIESDVIDASVIAVNINAAAQVLRLACAAVHRAAPDICEVSSVSLDCQWVLACNFIRA